MRRAAVVRSHGMYDRRPRAGANGFVPGDTLGGAGQASTLGTELRRSRARPAGNLVHAQSVSTARTFSRDHLPGTAGVHKATPEPRSSFDVYIAAHRGSRKSLEQPLDSDLRALADTGKSHEVLSCGKDLFGQRFVWPWPMPSAMGHGQWKTKHAASHAAALPPSVAPGPQAPGAGRQRSVAPIAALGTREKMLGESCGSARPCCC